MRRAKTTAPQARVTLTLDAAHLAVFDQLTKACVRDSELEGPAVHAAALALRAAWRTADITALENHHEA